MSNHSLDRLQKAGNVPVVATGGEVLVRDDQEFVNRLAERKRGLLARFMPSSAADRKIAEFESKMVGQAADAKAENYRMYLEVQRQAIKEALDAFLEQGKVRSRQGRTEFFEYHSRDLQQKVLDSTTAYLEDMSRRFEELEASTMIPPIKLRQRKLLEQRMDEHINAVEVMMQRFSKIIEEGV